MQYKEQKFKGSDGKKVVRFDLGGRSEARAEMHQFHL